MLAHVTQIAYNSRHRPGGGPHTLNCSVCLKRFNEGELIDTGTRRRDNEPVWENENSPRYAYKLTYKHLSCRHPYGVNAAVVPTPQPTNPNITNPTPDISPTNAPTSVNDDLIASIVAAINKQLIPQLESVASDLSRDIAAIAADMSTLAARVTNLEAAQPTVINVTMPNGDTHTVTIDRQHSHFNELLDLIRAGAKNIFINGPKGSGKSTAVKMIAKALNAELVLIGMVSDPTDIFGYQNTVGEYVATNFFRGFTSTTPTIILLDEVDGWDARAGLAANPALANGICAFPHGTFERGEHVTIIACANTWGTGPTAEFVGRNKLDDTTLDRFRTQDWPYDEAFEKHLAGYNTGSATVDAFIDACIATRHDAERLHAKVSISPRPVIEGATLLRNGLSPAATIKACFARERSHNMWPSVGSALETFASTVQPTVAGIAAD